ncbi:hypothetical protein BPS13_0067 [Bacillus phage BPS13]|uniref:Uncharacterized protein n=1 Tax=Bacillus phage BPS13 TaxID=1136731 RepID=J9PUG2_9CAUD|nr:hypothetical protein BPS13_0067 [Bacillus phage BPS13]AEZ50246.1 hypothetical protein BPS13_0067 [Bacillus phage BPS13]
MTNIFKTRKVFESECVHNKGTDKDETVTVKLTKNSRKVKFTHYYANDRNPPVKVKLKHDKVQGLTEELERIIKDEPTIFHREFTNKEDYVCVTNTNCSKGGILAFQVYSNYQGLEVVHMNRNDVVNLISHLKELMSIMK